MQMGLAVRAPTVRGVLSSRCRRGAPAVPPVARPFVAVAALLGATLSASEASAHAVPAAMYPAPDARLDVPPREVVIRFTERVEPRPSTLEVLDARGRRVDSDAAAVDPGDPWRYRVGLSTLPAGAYTVSWRVLSADDGHITNGAYVFTIGATDPAAVGGGLVGPDPVGWRSLARWLLATGGALLLGAVIAAPLLGLDAARRLRRMEILGGAGVIIGGTLDLVLQARELAGARPLAVILAPLLATGPGYVWLARGGLLGLLLAVSFRPTPVAPTLRARWWARVLLSAAVVMVGGLVSHAAAVVEGRWLVLWAETLHLVAVAGWVGALLAFATVFWRTRSGAGAEPGAAPLVVTLPRFSRFAALAVGILAVSGLLLARLHLSAWSELVRTSYGRWLAAKLVVFAAMLALGAWHYGGVERRLLRALEDGEAAPGPVARFRRSVRLEAALGVAALGLAGVLGVTGPPAPPGFTGADQAAASFRHDRTLAEARVRLEVAPLRPGPNAIHLTMTDPAGRPLADATAAIVQLTPADASVGAVTFQLDRVGPGAFAAPAAVLGLIGRWSGRLVVQRSNAYDVNDRFELVVGAGTVPHAHGQPAAVSRGAPPLDRYTMMAALAAAAVTVAVSSTSRRRLLVARRLVANASRPPAAGPARS